MWTRDKYRHKYWNEHHPQAVKERSIRKKSWPTALNDKSRVTLEVSFDKIRQRDRLAR